MKNRTLLEIAVFNDGRSMTQIAKLAGVNRSSLSQIVNGRRYPRLETSLRIAQALGVKPESVGLVSLSDITKESKSEKQN